MPWATVYSFSVGTYYSAQNKDVATVPAGGACAVHTSGTGIVLALAANLNLPCVGLSQAAVAPTFAGNVQTSGVFTMADWTAVIGSALLSAHALYFLDPVTPGMLTSTPPTTVGFVLQIIGEAVSTTTLDLLMDTPILL